MLLGGRWSAVGDPCVELLRQVSSAGWLSRWVWCPWGRELVTRFRLTSRTRCCWAGVGLRCASRASGGSGRSRRSAACGCGYGAGAGRELVTRPDRPPQLGFVRRSLALRRNTRASSGTAQGQVGRRTVQVFVVATASAREGVGQSLARPGFATRRRLGDVDPRRNTRTPTGTGRLHQQVARRSGRGARTCGSWSLALTGPTNSALPGAESWSAGATLARRATPRMPRRSAVHGRVTFLARCSSVQPPSTPTDRAGRVAATAYAREGVGQQPARPSSPTPRCPTDVVPNPKTQAPTNTAQAPTVSNPPARNVPRTSATRNTSPQAPRRPRYPRCRNRSWPRGRCPYGPVRSGASSSGRS